MAYAEHKGDGGAAEIEPSYFHCAVCGASARSADVTYGRLGYPECPVCETQYGPEVASSTSSNGADGQ